MHDIPHSQATREKISRSLSESENVGRPKGSFVSEETREKMRNTKLNSIERLDREIPRNKFKSLFPNAKKTSGNKYNFINQDKKIQVKGSTLSKKNDWRFNIRNNKNCDIFALFAYDNTENKNLLYFWMIPTEIIDHLNVVSVSEGTQYKFAEYKIDLEI